MSIRAMNWALEQKTDGPSAQSVLFVIADSANEHGITFHCNPDYIAEKTRQSRGTVFRRMAELEEVGGLERISHHKNDGRRLYEVRLKFEARLNYKIDREGTIIYLDDNDDPIEAGECQIETHGGGESQIDTQTESPVIHPECHSCNSQDSIALSVKNPPKNPAPNPSQAGGALKNETDEDFEKDFEKLKADYPQGILDLEAARVELIKVSAPDRKDCLRSLPIYADRLRGRGRGLAKMTERSMKAHIFIRKRCWEGLLASTNKAAAAPSQHSIASEAGRALMTLGRIMHYTPLVLTGNVIGEVTPRVQALATAPPIEQWKRASKGSGNYAAWRELAWSVWPGKGFAFDSIDIPWDWPPRKDGSIITSSTDPPTELSDEDARALMTGT